jgi:mutator protein MutT
MDFSLNPKDFNPRHSASGCIIVSGDKVLFLQRKSKNFKETVWAIPAGKIEEGETPEQTLKREVTEETGLIITDISQVEKYHIRLYKKNYDFVYFLFKSTVPENAEVIISDEHIDYAWVKPEKVDELLLESGAEIYKKIIQQDLFTISRI